MALELNALKFATNVSFSDCRSAIVAALWNQSEGLKGPSVSQLWKQWAHLLSKFTHGLDGQAHLLEVLEKEAHNAESALLVAFSVPPLYECDVVEDQVIVDWANNLKNPILKQYLSPFVKFLQEEDDENDDDENSDEDADYEG